jgi:hypothetical protein
MSRNHPECPDSDPSDRSVAADVLLRQEPDEGEDEEEEDDRKKEEEGDDDTTDDGYSEWPWALRVFLEVPDCCSRLNGIQSFDFPQ